MKFPYSPSVIKLSVLTLSILILGCGKNDNPLKTADPNLEVHSTFVGFTNHYLDLESGLIDTVISPDIPNGITDLRNSFSSSRDIHATIVQQSGREIAYLGAGPFSAVTDRDLDTATFTSETIDIPFDSTTILLLKTDLGAIYKLGNPVEDIDGVRFDYQLLVEAEVP